MKAREGYPLWVRILGGLGMGLCFMIVLFLVGLYCVPLALFIMIRGDYECEGWRELYKNVKTKLPKSMREGLDKRRN